MRLSRVAGGLAVLLTLAAVVGSLATFAGANDLFLAPARRLPALVTTVFVALVVGGVVRWGGSEHGRRTPYW